MIPNKRIKLDTNEHRNAIILSEIDIEIGLRKRLAQTFESRIAWASLLLDSLENETEYISETPFKDVALTALSALESPSKILFPRDADVPIPNAQKGRLPPKEKPITRSQKSKFLYLRSQDSPQIFLLRCPDCHQSAFTNLQGLYNHSRISHSKEWGSHEELAKACAVPQEELDYELDLDAGVDAGGRGTLLPGVRSLFQMAVEGTRDQSPSRVSNQGEQQSVHLTKTLGLHGDSPALAQFLGKEVKRKEIKVWNDENFIDIYSLPLPPMSRWKKPPPVRTRPTREAEVVTSEKSLQATANDSSRNASNATATSRFHISCRITLTDSSLFIPEGQRLKSKKEHTHQWMISVESASYSLDLTTVLASLTVSPISSFEIEQSMSSSPLVATEPPFVVVGTTAEPFQAQVELLFNSSTSGPGQNGQKVILDHWIGLDMIGTNKLPTKGDEQVVDIELDKDTVIKPAKSGYTPVNAKSHWEHVSNVALGRALKFKQGELSVDTAIPGSYTELLESLVTKFPMTQKDNASKTAPNFPYKLLPSPASLKALVVGRRKAIEWGRARAVQEAYTECVKALREHDPCVHLVSFTTGDVYAWMEDNGHFIRTRERKITPAIDEDSPQNDNNAIDLSEGKWCRVCGLGLWAHGAPGLEYMKTEAQLITAAAQARSAEKDKPVLPRIRLKLMSGKVVGRSGPSLPPPPRPPPFQCQIVVKMLQLLKMPVVDIHRIFVPRIQNEPTPSTSLLNPHQLPPWSSRAPRLVKDDPTIVSAVDPHFTLGVWSLVNSLQLPYFAPPSPLVPFPLDTTGVDATDVNANLAPHALLALATRQFIRVLIREAQEVEKRDKELGVGFLFESHNRDVSLLASAPPTRKYNKTGAASVAGRKGKEKEKLKIESIKVLTPMHIITGVVSNYVRATALSSMSSEGRFGSNEGSVGIAIFGCLSRIGIGVEEKQLEK